MSRAFTPTAEEIEEAMMDVEPSNNTNETIVEQLLDEQPGSSSFPSSSSSSSSLPSSSPSLPSSSSSSYAYKEINNGKWSDHTTLLVTETKIIDGRRPQVLLHIGVPYSLALASEFARFAVFNRNEWSMVSNDNRITLDQMMVHANECGGNLPSDVFVDILDQPVKQMCHFISASGIHVFTPTSTVQK